MNFFNNFNKLHIIRAYGGYKAKYKIFRFIEFFNNYGELVETTGLEPVTPTLPA
jgi:hypothetical protein